MRTGVKWSLALLFGLSVAQSEGKELLGGISDETAPPVAQPEPSAKDNERRIIYRVICSPEGEQLPDCAQPPVTDNYQAEQPARSENPEAAAIADTPEEQSGQKEQGDQSSNGVEPAAPKKASAHKKRSKKSVKKHDKKTTKPATKRKRHQD